MERSIHARVFFNLMSESRALNGESQKQPLRAGFAEKLVELVSQRKAEGATEKDPLVVFYYASGKVRGRLSPSSLYRIFTGYAKRCGIKAAPHSARAAAITKLLIDGFRLIDVKKFARHASWRACEAYDHRKLEPETAPLPNYF